MNPKLVFLVLAIAAVGFPTVVYANAGTPLMLGTVFHLVAGNAFIGIGEGFLLAILFRLKILPCIAVMIAANYFSAGIGYCWLLNKVSQSLDFDLYNAWHWMWTLALFSYLITLFLEWPFVALCMRKTPHWIRKSLLGVLATQSASYLILFGWYWPVSGTSLYRNYEIVQPSEIAVASQLQLYYISETDGDVYVMDLDRRVPKMVAKLDTRCPDDMLYLRKSSTAEGRWDLMVYIPSPNPDRSQSKVILADCSDRGYSEDILRKQGPNGSWWNFGKVPHLEGEDTDWEFECGYWAVEGLHGENKKDQRKMHLSWETPFAEWYIRDAVELPSGQVIFQLGVDQICLFDPDAKKIARLVKGHGPLVAVKHSPE